MTIRYDLHIVFPDGRFEDRSVDFAEPRVVAGRGGSSTLILDGRGVALEHARFEFRGEKLFVVDVSTGFTLRVNNVQVVERELKGGDRVSIGERTLTVRLDGGIFVLREERRQEEAAEGEKYIADALKRLSMRAHMPSMKAVVFFAMAITLFGAQVIPDLTRKTLFTSGTISHPHQQIEAQCESCHTHPFERVEDSSCLTCHRLTEHVGDGKSPRPLTLSTVGLRTTHPANSHAEAALVGRCGDCHMEHSGDGPIVISESGLCLKCHGEVPKSSELEEKLKGVLTVPTFDRHPEFRVSMPAQQYDVNSSKNRDLPLERVTLGSEKAKDFTALKLNHEVHLKQGIRGANGPVTLQCADCHQLKSDYSTMQPISFQKHCQSCHRLAFDDELPDDLVPHGKPEDVYNTVFAAYAQLFLENTKSATIESITRRLPGQDAPRGIERQEQREYARARVQEAARLAEQNIFERTACHLCHEVTKRDNVDAVSLESRYDIVRPNVPQSWFPASTFNHGSHERVRCESCHQDVKSSKTTTDILLPQIAQCKDCHAHGASEGARVDGKVQSDCILCHSFHDSLPLPNSQKH